MNNHVNQGYWAIVYRRLKHNKLALTGGSIILILFAMAIFAPLLSNDRPLIMKYQGRLYFPVFHDYAEFRNQDFTDILPKAEWCLMPPIPYSPINNDLDETLQPPSAKHWLGTDENGRDVTARMIYGAQVSMKVGFVAVGISLLIGVYIGSLAGYYGGWVDNLISRFIEIMMCFPFFFLVLAVMAFLEPGINKIMIVIGITSWTGMARLVRGEILKIKNEEYIMAARALGLSDFRIIFRHILPNAIAPVLVSATFGVASAVLVESSLTFLGFGVQIPTPSWGEILSQGERYLQIGWWLALFPGIAIFITVFAYNILGEGLRDAMDPRISEAVKE